MNLWGKILSWCGWKVSITAPRRDKCIICVAPHTSNWDFILGLAAYQSLGRKANFLMKEFWFFFPLKYILKAFGGIPVPSKKNGRSVTKEVVELFRTHPYVNLAVTPEGTRSRREQWHSGFLHMSYEAHVPIQLGIINYAEKRIVIHDEFYPTGDIDADMKYVKGYYKNAANAAKYPEKFTV